MIYTVSIYLSHRDVYSRGIGSHGDDDDLIHHLEPAAARQGIIDCHLTPSSSSLVRVEEDEKREKVVSVAPVMAETCAVKERVISRNTCWLYKV